MTPSKTVNQIGWTLLQVGYKTVSQIGWSLLQVGVEYIIKTNLLNFGEKLATKETS